MSDRSEIEWAPRVSLHKIRRLYVEEARGSCPDEFIDEVGFSLYARCASILEFTAAVNGRVKCMRCSKSGTAAFIERKTRQASEMLRCPACGWQVRWRVYLVEADRLDGSLHAGNAGAAFQRFVSTYPQSRTREEKILAIDRLIHEFHWNLMAEDEALQPHKPAGVNLLRGSTTQVIEMLNELTYGENTPPELLASRDWWRAQKPIVRRQGPVQKEDSA